MDEPEHSDEPPPQPGGPPHDELTVEIIDPDALLSAPAKRWLRQHAALLADALHHRFARSGEARARIVNDAAMGDAHERHTGVAGTTDVLTFDLSDSAAIDTDILICADEARRRAREHAHTPERELLLYITHALLHCLGYDDHDDTGYAAMHTLEDELLEQIGVGATFDPSAKGAAP